MIRSSFLWIKHLFNAVVVLAILCCLAEVGLRVYDSCSGQVTRRDLYDRGLTCRSWFVHHTLRPSKTFAVKNSDTGQKVRVAINSLGLRGPEPVLPKPPGVYRILCLGDDTTFAPQIPEAQTFCALLQAELQRRSQQPIEVVNAGVPDYCPLLSYLQIKHQLLGLQPDVVIVNFDMSDVSDDYQYRRHTILGTASVPSTCGHPALKIPRTMGTRQEDILLLPQWTKQKLGELWVQKMMTESQRSIDTPQGRYVWLEDQAPDWSIYIDQTLHPIAQIQQLAQGLGAELMVVIAPAPWQVSTTASPGARERVGVPPGVVYRSPAPAQAVQAYCQAKNIRCLNTIDDFRQQPAGEKLFLKKVAAFSAEGHVLYARELLQLLAGPPSQSPQIPQTPIGSESIPDWSTLPQARLNSNSASEINKK